MPSKGDYWSSSSCSPVRSAWGCFSAENTALLSFCPCLICFLHFLTDFSWEHFLNKSLTQESRSSALLLWILIQDRRVWKYWSNWPKRELKRRVLIWVCFINTINPHQHSLSLLGAPITQKAPCTHAPSQWRQLWDTEEVRHRSSPFDLKLTFWYHVFN